VPVGGLEDYAQFVRHEAKRSKRILRSSRSGETSAASESKERAYQLGNEKPTISRLKPHEDGDGGLLSPPPEHGLDWAGVMQHHRAPTLLLDWSYSPFVAAYFAVAELDRRDKDGAVWFFNEELVDCSANCNMHVKAIRTNAPADPLLRKYGSYCSSYPNARMKAQQSLFTWCRSLEKTHDEIIDDVLGTFKIPGNNAAGVMLGLPDMREHYGQLIIPAALKHDILRELAVRKGISGQTIYTGLDGIGQAVAEFIKLRVATASTPVSVAAPLLHAVRP
jgi:FRG domain